MKVANIIEEARVGGPQRRIAEVADRLRAFNVETVVIGPESNSERFDGLVRERGASYVALPMNGPSGRLEDLLKYAAFFVPDVWRLTRCLRRGRFDLVHVSGGSWQVKGVIAARLAGLPSIWHLNDTHRPLPVRLLFRLVSACVPATFAVAGRRVRSYYLGSRRLKQRAVFEIPAPVDMNRFDPSCVTPEPRLARRGCSLVVLLASVNPDKGVTTFVEKAERVAKQVRQVEFWIVGPTHDTQTAYRARIEKSIEESGLASRLRFFGESPDPASVLAVADVAVCSSRSEASPMAVWEAMAMQTPVVSTDVGDVRRYLEATESGFVVSVGDARSAAGCVMRLLRDVKLREGMGRRGRETVREHLSLEKCAERHFAAYEFVAGKRG